MAEILTPAYQDLRDYIEANWKWIELRDNLGAAILRVDTTDIRVSWTHTPGAQTLELTIALSGTDAEFENTTPGDLLPQTFQYSAIYDVSTVGDAYSVEEYTPFTMETVHDDLTVKHQIEVPWVE